MIGGSWIVGRVVRSEEDIISVVEEAPDGGHVLRTYRRPAPGQMYRDAAPHAALRAVPPDGGAALPGPAAAPGYSPGVERG